MKYSLLTIVAFFSIVTFSSCKKSSATSPYYVKATINGVNVVYTGYTGALKVQNVLRVNGFNSTAINTADGININFGGEYSNTIPVIGIYTDTADNISDIYKYYATDTSANYTTEYYYGNSFSMDIYTQQAGMQYSNAFNNANPFVATITAINSTSVSGTFSGTVYYGSAAPNLSETITNGSFYVPF
jgi:hypothetical protein